MGTRYQICLPGSLFSYRADGSRGRPKAARAAQYVFLVVLHGHGDATLSSPLFAFHCCRTIHALWHEFAAYSANVEQTPW